MSCGSGLAADAFGFEPVHALLAPARARYSTFSRRPPAVALSSPVVKVGGVVRDVDDAMFAYIKQVLEGLKDQYRQIMNTLLTDTSVKNRLVGVGYVSHDDAVAQSMVGPFGRASRATTMCACSATAGTASFPGSSPSCPTTAIAMRAFGCAALRCCSPSISSKVISRMPAGDIEVKVKGNPADGAEACNVLEQPRGGATTTPAATLQSSWAHAHAHANLPGIAGMTIALKGCDLADVNNIILTIDPCISCTER